MTWLLFATLTAIFESLKDIAGKRSLKNVDEYLVAWSMMGFSLPILIPLLFVIDIPPLGDRFWLALMVSGILNTIAWLMYIKAINSSDLSLTVPLITFTPLFLLVTSPVMVGEYPTSIQTLGIFLIVIGSYTLNLKQRHQGAIAPFKALLEQTGPKLMLGVAFIWSFTANIDKIGVQNSSPTLWSVALFSAVTVGLLPIALSRSRQHLRQIVNYFPSLLPIGILNSGAILFQMRAIDLAMVTQVIAVKRTSALITVFLGCLVFKEQGLKERATGAAMMILGVILSLLGE